MTHSLPAPDSRAVHVTTDTFETIPEYDRLREAVNARDWQLFESTLADFALDEASYAISLLAETPGVDEFLDAAASENPDSSLVRTTVAMRHMFLGWTARGRGPAKDISPPRMARFRERFVLAEQMLIDVCARRTPCASAWVARVQTARALEVGESEARRRFEHLTRLSPDDFPGATHMLRYLLPTWLGSPDKVKDFVHEAVGAAPPGSNFGALVAFQHLEQWSYVGRGESGSVYLGQATVVAELKDAANRSVLHPGHTMSPLGVQAHSAFAMAFWLADHNENAAVHLRSLAGRSSAYPWNLAPSAALALADCRDEVLGTNEGTSA